MKLLLVLLSVSCLAAATQWRQLPLEQQSAYTFEHFKTEFGRSYGKEEENFRRQIFEKRLAGIVAHNKAGLSWKKGVNEFTDRTPEEYKARLGLKGYRTEQRAQAAHWASEPESSYKNADISSFVGANIDWRTKGVISEPKNQGACGSCWTFGTTETIESYNALKTGKMVLLSEQQILDCTPNPNHCGGTGGCGGGTVELAVDRIVEMGGLSSAASYPYVSGTGGNYPCNKVKIDFAVNVTKYIDLPSNVLAPMLNHVASKGPLAISVDASSWAEYASGVFDGCNNASPDLNHAVQLVGFGTDPTEGDYWLIRNSWGTTYGEEGYIRIKRYATSPCGIDTTPSHGNGCDGGPPSIKVCGNCGILYDATYVVIG